MSKTFDGGGVLEHDGTLVYHMDSVMNNWVALDNSIGAGSGKADMFMYIPDSSFSSFSSSAPLTLYSVFGQQGANPSDLMGGNFTGDFGNNAGGGEDWGLRQNVAIPEPSSLLFLILCGTLVAGYRRASAVLV